MIGTASFARMTLTTVEPLVSFRFLLQGLTGADRVVSLVIQHRTHTMHEKPFLSPFDIAHELDISTTTVLRLIHAGTLPAIHVSERIYRIPVASFEMYKAGTLRAAEPAPVGRVLRQPRLGDDEVLPVSRGGGAAIAR